MPTDSLCGILGCFKDNRAGTFRATICTDVDVSTNDIARSTEQIFEILPPCLIGQLQSDKKSEQQHKKLLRTYIADIELISRVIVGSEVVMGGRTRRRSRMQALTSHCHSYFAWNGRGTESSLIFSVLINFSNNH